MKSDVQKETVLTVQRSVLNELYTYLVICNEIAFNSPYYLTSDFATVPNQRELICDAQIHMLGSNTIFLRYLEHLTVKLLINTIQSFRDPTCVDFFSIFICTKYKNCDIPARHVD